MTYKQNSTDLDDLLAVDSEWNFEDLGDLYVFGYNGGTLGGLIYPSNISSPILVPGGMKWRKIATGHRHTLALTTANQLYVWGYNNWGELGLGITESNSEYLTRIMMGDTVSSFIMDIAIGYEDPAHGSSYFLTDINELYAFGYNGSGRLGISNTTNQSAPQQVGVLSLWKKISSNVDSCAGIRYDDKLYTWGNGSTGQLGKGNTLSYSSPVSVGTSTWKQVSVGEFFMAGIRTTGALYTWGDNYYGQLGLGDTNGRSSPVQVGTATDWVKVSCGYTHCVAINSSGQAYAWGNNADGQLGVGNITNRSSPVLISGSTVWSDVSCGSFHTLLVGVPTTDSKSHIYSCGNNGSGQLGLGDSNGRSSPVHVCVGSYVFAGAERSYVINAEDVEY